MARKDLPRTMTVTGSSELYSLTWNGYTNLENQLSTSRVTEDDLFDQRAHSTSARHATCLNAMEEAYRELNEGRAGYRPRIDFYVPEEPHYYRWGTMEGASRKLGVFAIRTKSDMLAWEEQDGFKVEDKYCMQRGTYCGLIFLLSTRNAEPLALMNDGFLQHMRVGACAGLGTKYLARKNSKVLAMIGSGGMARTYAMAIKQVRPIETMRVFSPTKANREAYAAEMTEQLDIEVVPVDSPEKALKGADIVSLTTDSLVPVIKADWLEPGMHINNVRNNETGADVLKRADVRARLGTSTLFADRSVSGVATGSDGMFAYIAGNAEEKQQIPCCAASGYRQSQYRHSARYHGRPLGGPGQRSAGYVSQQPGDSRAPVRRRRRDGLQSGESQRDSAIPCRLNGSHRI